MDIKELFETLARHYGTDAATVEKAIGLLIMRFEPDKIEAEIRIKEAELASIAEVVEQKNSEITTLRLRQQQATAESVAVLFARQ